MRVHPSVLLGGALLSGCVTSLRPFNDDFSEETPERALSLAVDRLSDVYSFTAWKGLDWPAIEAELSEELDENSDPDTIFRKLAQSMPDGHVSIWNDDRDRNPCPEADGSLGFRVARTDEDDLVVVHVDRGGSAAIAGVQPGDRFDGRAGSSAEDALAAAPLHCSPLGLATVDRQEAVAGVLVGRGPLGASVDVQIGGQALVLEAVDREGAWRHQLGLQAANERLSARMVGDGIGVLAIGWEDTVLSEEGFRRRLKGLWRQGARRLVLDLRDNDGGTDQTAANIVGTFTDRSWFYETITMYDRRTERQAEVSEVWVEPQELRWDLPVVVLVNGNTVSSGEGMAMMLARFPDVEVVGLEGTAASFGSAGSSMKLPGGWTMSYPAGRSLDRRGRIQLDSDASLTGGVQPTLPVPRSVDNLVADAQDPDNHLIELAIELGLGGR